MKKYYFISYRIDISRQTPVYSSDVTDKTPFEYILYYKKLGGSYQDRCILYAEEITEEQYSEYSEAFDG